MIEVLRSYGLEVFPGKNYFETRTDIFHQRTLSCILREANDVLWPSIRRLNSVN